MPRIKNILETIKGNEDFSELRASSLRDILTGRILTKRVIWKQYGLAALIALLAFSLDFTEGKEPSIKILDFSL